MYIHIYVYIYDVRDVAAKRLDSSSGGSKGVRVRVNPP